MKLIMNEIFRIFFKDPVKKVKQIMTSIGFTSVEVECLQKAFIFPNQDALQGKFNF